MAKTVRTKREQNSYREHISRPDNTICNYCHEFEQMEPDSTYTYFVLRTNESPYEIWDESLVDEHVLLIPRRHVVSLSELSEEEREEYDSIVDSLLAKSYSIFIRPPDKSNHAVTHCIRSSSHRLSWMLYIKRPHIVWYH